MLRMFVTFCEPKLRDQRASFPDFSALSAISAVKDSRFKVNRLRRCV